ncbi:hypothetical protein FEM48_Zijuj07G0094900 [Ziziphus jujuba var. spinosa]|uniref:Amine oxidase domain-containing protein n=1 Tax=Ziziphus jujuba var. spinosa TaxID=714518 RepID=A0A978V3U9_ZIZJJ|nr:uncharacterized protein LOC107422786 [Ziziphus jujuba var. spinosa]KAH7522032.1 hypothetical protein FEM48_Zijuj07G0094900 [Ziziphus jujuba var. spinosa]
MRVAVIGGGFSGLVSAYILAKNGIQVVLYEKEDYLGGHSKTVTIDGFDLDLGFMVFNTVTYPNMIELFEKLGVGIETSEMSFSVSLDRGRGCEWGSRNGLSSLFAQKKNLFNPYFFQMLKEIFKFKDDAFSYLEELENNPDVDHNETLGQFVKSYGYSELFQKAYLVPICSSAWPCPAIEVMSFSARSVLSFCLNNHLLQIFGRPKWLTIKGKSHYYMNKVREELESRGCQIRTRCEVQKISTNDEGCIVLSGDGSEEVYRRCILALHAPDAVKILADQVTPEELRVLGAFQYFYSDIFLHRDKNLMPQNQAAWSAWNFVGSTDEKICLTYWLNVLQNIGDTSLPFFVTFNPEHPPKHTLFRWSTGHPVPSVAASKALLELHHIQGKRGIWFCGAYGGYGFSEDALKAGIASANGILGKSFSLLSSPKYMVPSLVETGACRFVTRFLRDYISNGCLVLLEEGGTIFNFGKTTTRCSLKTVLTVHNPQFYWKVMTQADLGLVDAYVNGDCSLVDKDEGLLHLFEIFIANRDANRSVSNVNKKSLRGWWTPLLFTASISSAKFFFQHVCRQNTLTQARRNISRHYDLSNELFALFLGETMQYSSAIFKSKDEDLNSAQLRKVSVLIEKARICKKHEVLDIGCGWGFFAIQLVKQTGCNYTGITLSDEQLKFAQKKVADAGLQDHIKFLLCDYRQLPSTSKFDRIISCEMLEHVGHGKMDEFFGCCESVLAEDGIFVLQFIAIPDERYEEYRQSSDFIKEYIFPGGCLPSLSRVTSAMATSSRFCVEHLENIGPHYYTTLRLWRKNFLENQSEIVALGFDEKFIRTWEYYFDYCAAGFKTHTLNDYQMVFSRPGNANVDVAAFNTL